MNVILEFIKEGIMSGAILFNNAIVTFDNEIGNIKTDVHLGGFHDKMDISSDNFQDDVIGYLSDDWEVGDEERIVYKDKLVIFGLDDVGERFIKVYPYKKVNETISDFTL